MTRYGNVFATLNEQSNIIAQNTSGCMPSTLKIESIDENPKNEHLFNMDGIESLAKFIKERGFYQPIIVFRKANNRYEVIAGHRKLRAQKLNGATTIDAIIRPAPATEGDKSYQVIFDNINARVLTPMDTARCLEEIKNTWISEKREAGEVTGKSTAILARLFRMSESKVVRLLRLLTLQTDIQDLIDSGDLTPDAVTPIIAIKDEELKKEVQVIVANYVKDKRQKNEEIEITKLDIERIINNYKKSNMKGQSEESPETILSPFSKQVSATLKSVEKMVKLREKAGSQLDTESIKKLIKLKETVEELLSSQKLSN